jgi:hypothetical protein
MSFSGWIKRKPHSASLIGIKAVKINQKETNTISLVFTLTDSTKLETNTIMLPPGPSISIKDVKVLQKNKDRMSFEIVFSDDTKVVTDTFLFMPIRQSHSAEITTIVANHENILLATSLGLDYGVDYRTFLHIPWNKDIIWTSKTVELGENKDEITVKKSGILSVFATLYLKVKVPQGVKTIQLKIVKKPGHVLGMTVITLPSGKVGEDVSFNAGSYRFTNLILEADQSFSVMLQCWSSDRIHIGVEAGTILEVMWFSPADH